MNIPEANDYIQLYFNTAWSASGNPYSSIPVLFDNDETEVPNNESFVRISIKYRKSKQNSLGMKTLRKFGRYGFISFQVFVLGGTGTYTGSNICQKIIDIFEGEGFDGVDFEAGYFTPTGKDEIWFQYNGIIDFWFEETK